MDNSGAGPSDAKRNVHKVIFKDPKKLANDELLAILEASSDDEMFSDSDDNFVPDDESDDIMDMDDDDRATVLPIVQQAQTQVPIAAPTTNSTVAKWSDVSTNMKNFQFLKTNELLQAISGKEPIDYVRAILERLEISRRNCNCN
ncbi:hypothetical protein NQ314_020495 [Rhamnusium bicolor]|uniref:Uncharacterized protein n=1 Tax=Rhamnusium bicolor TaxID=1586634 RepID=A0AAV8WLL7_9CUCU|nr:hypothetical protein NQ314_020495 [Rhamnusium bicolor]